MAIRESAFPDRLLEAISGTWGRWPGAVQKFPRASVTALLSPSSSALPPLRLSTCTRNNRPSSAGDTVWFAIRPEKLRVSAKKPATKLNTMSGEVWDIAYLGDMTVYNIRLDDGTIVKASKLNAARAADEKLTWHDRAWLSFAPDAGILLQR